MVREVLTRLHDDLEKLGRFDSVLSTASQFTPVSEGRAYWQLALTGSIRVPCLAFGERLREADLLDDTADIFYLSLDEIKVIASGAGRDELRCLVSERREDRCRWMGVVPPVYIGAPVDPSATQDSIRSLKFGLGLETQAEE